MLISQLHLPHVITNSMRPLHALSHSIIKEQLEGDIISGAFDVGIMQGTVVVNVRSQEDLNDVWMEARRGGKVVLWCDALKEVQLKKSKH